MGQTTVSMRIFPLEKKGKPFQPLENRLGSGTANPPDLLQDKRGCLCSSKGGWIGEDGEDLEHPCIGCYLQKAFG